MESFFYLKFNPVSVFESITHSFKSLNKFLLHQFIHGGFFGIIISFILVFLNLLYPIFLFFFILYYNLFNIFEFLIDSFRGFLFLKYLFLPTLYIVVLIALIYIGVPTISFIVSVVINILVGIWNFILYILQIMTFLLAWIWLILKYSIIVLIVAGVFLGIYQINEDSYGDNIFFSVIGTMIFGVIIIGLYVWLVDSLLGGFNTPTFFRFLSIIGRIL